MAKQILTFVDWTLNTETGIKTELILTGLLVTLIAML